MNISQISLHPRDATAPTEDKTKILSIVTWVTLVLPVLAFVVRQFIKFAMRRKAGIDDLFILAATAFAIGHSITVLILASDGLGILGVLTVARANAIMKAYYATDFLYVSSLSFSKLSLLFFFYSVHHQRGQRQLVVFLGTFILAWMLASLAAIAFQCGLPRPWEILTLHCFNTGAFWIVYCIIDMTTDVAIIMLSIDLVAYLKVNFSRKLAVVACFLPRLLVVATALARLIFLYPISPHNNPSFNLWVPLICTQVQVCLSVATACIPYVRPFFETTEASIRRISQARKSVTIHTESYGCCSVGYHRGYKRAKGQSADSTILTSSFMGRTPDVSPRLPSPRPLSPLTPPRFDTSPTTPIAGSRSPSTRGLRLQIPTQENSTQRTDDFSSARTASSHALSPACLSPRPLLSSVALSSVDLNSPQLPTTQSPMPVIANPTNAAPPRDRPQASRRFSLFPPPQQEYSPLPQQLTRPTLLAPSPVTERLHSNRVTHVRHGSASQTPETRTPLPAVPSPQPSTSRLMIPLRGSSSLEKVASDDPLRTAPMAVATSAAVQAPVPAALPSMYEAHSSIPHAYVQTPSTAQMTYTSPRSGPSQPPRSPRFGSNAYGRPPSQASPTSPQRQRNNRILTPQNSSRRDQMSPVSPISPPTPCLTFWRDESSNESAGTQRSTDGWEEAHLMPIVRDVRSSPRIVVQRFS